MRNIVLFAITVLGYFGLLWWLGGAPDGGAEYAVRFGILALLCIPLNINGTVWTVLGNAESEKSIYSLCSLYQKAGKHAVTIIGVSSQQHTERNAVVLFGISFLQNAGQDAVIFVGVSLYQNAEQEAYTGLGVSFYQKAGKIATVAPVAVALQQTIVNEKGARASRTFGAFSSLKFPEEPQEKAPPAEDMDIG